MFEASFTPLSIDILSPNKPGLQIKTVSCRLYKKTQASVKEYAAYSNII